MESFREISDGKETNMSEETQDPPVGGGGGGGKQAGSGYPTIGTVPVQPPETQTVTEVEPVKGGFSAAAGVPKPKPDGEQHGGT